MKKYAHWLFLSCCVALPCQAELNLPDLGDPASRYLSPAQERDFGRAIIQQIRHAGAMTSDVIQADYIQHVGDKLVDALPFSDIEYHFFLINQNSINAFALPGGYIGVHSGLLLAVESEDELAAVMAHEIAHVKQRHIARFWGHAQQVALSSVVGLIAAAAVTAAAPEAGSGIISSVLASQHQSLINFTRQQEQEADNVGIRILADAGYAPNAMPSFFRTLGTHTRYSAGPSLEYLRTHPLTENRIAHAEMRAGQYAARPMAEPSLLHRLAKTRAKLDTFSHAREALHYFEDVETTALEKAYGRGLALLNSGRAKEAESALASLINTYPNEPLIRLALAEASASQANEAQATQRFEALLRDYPHHHAATLSYAHWLIEQEKPKKALDYLTGLQTLRPDDPQAFHLSAQAYAALGQTINAYIAQANFRASEGELYDALTQLRHAKELTEEDSPERFRIEARLEEVLSDLENIRALP